MSKLQLQINYSFLDKFLTSISFILISVAFHYNYPDCQTKITRSNIWLIDFNDIPTHPGLFYA